MSVRRGLLVLSLGVVLTIGTAAPVQADGGLTATVAASYFTRSVDANLHAIAHQRVLEISCGGCFNHAGMRPGTAEVIAYNFGQPDPIGTAVAGWRASPVHNGILSNTSLGRIGCAQTVAGVTSFFVCVLASGPLPVAAVPARVTSAPAAPAAGSGAGGGQVPGSLPDTST